MNLREIDRLVAEKVMGWEVPYEYDDIGIMAYTIEKGTFAFSPTTNIADAWQVIEKLTRGKKDLETYFELELFYKHYYVKFGKYEAKAETAPLAICLAALKAVGVEVEEDD